MSKKKTEMCHNFESKGYCKYQKHCTFAHSKKELQIQENDSFKTKPCKNYFKDGLCPYGQRCQYMHSEIKEQVKWWGYLKKQLRKMDAPYTFAWDKNERVQCARVDVMRFQRIVQLQEQLPFFKKLTSG